MPEKTQNLALQETKVDGFVAYDGDFLKLQKDNVSLPNGKITTREFIKHPGAVVIIPMFDDGRVLLERQFRYPLGRVFLEFPAGKIDPGEQSLQCAQRELREETGYQARNWRFLCTIHNAIAYSDEYLDIYLAQGLIAGDASLDEEEFLETFSTTLPEMMEWVKQGKITDVKTVIGTFWLEKIIDGKW